MFLVGLRLGPSMFSRAGINARSGGRPAKKRTAAAAATTSTTTSTTTPRTSSSSRREPAGQLRGPKWQVGQVRALVQHAPPEKLKNRQPPIPSVAVERGGGIVRNVQLVHNAPGSMYMGRAKAIPSPRAKSKKKLGRNHSGDAFASPVADAVQISAGEAATSWQQQVEQQQAAKAAAQSEFRKKMSKRISRRIQGKKANLNVYQQAWSDRASQAVNQAEAWANEVIESNVAHEDAKKPAGKKSVGGRKRSQLQLNQHILNVTANSQAARLALFAHSREGKEVIAGLGRDQMAPASPSAQNQALGSGRSEGTDTLQNAHERNHERSVILAVENMDADDIESYNASQLVAVTRAAEGFAQRMVARKYREDKQRRERRAKRRARLKAEEERQEKLRQEMLASKKKSIEDYENFKTTATKGVEELAQSQEVLASRQKLVAARYMKALRLRLLNKMRKHDLEVPNLCGCSGANNLENSGEFANV